MKKNNWGFSGRRKIVQQGIVFDQYMCCTFFGSGSCGEGARRVGSVVEFDYSDQVRDTSNDIDFARAMAKEYGLPVRFGDDYIKI